MVVHRTCGPVRLCVAVVGRTGPVVVRRRRGLLMATPPLSLRGCALTRLRKPMAGSSGPPPAMARSPPRPPFLPYSRPRVLENPGAPGKGLRFMDAGDGGRRKV